MLLKHTAHCALGLADHYRYIGLEYPGLFGSYSLGCVAEQCGMVERYVGDYTQVGGDYVGAVESSAEANFNHCYVDAAPGEELKCHHSGEFEKRRLQCPQCAVGQKALGKVYYLVLANHVAVNPDALAEVDQMRRGEQAYAEP